MASRIAAIGRGAWQAALAVVVFGCAQPETPPDQFYRVSIDVAEVNAPEPRFRGALEVERPKADGLLAGRPIIYVGSEPDAPLMEYRYDFWDKPPALMMQDELVRCLQSGRVAGLVITDQTRINADYSLIGQLLRFERIEGTSPSAAVEIKLGLRDNRNGRLLLWDTYAALVSASDATMPATVAAFGTAVSDICESLRTDLAALPSPRSAL